MEDKFMRKVHLRKITKDNLRPCLSLQVNDSQKHLVATPTQSLAEAYVDSNLFPLAVYDAAAMSHPTETYVRLESPG